MDIVVRGAVLAAEHQLDGIYNLGTDELYSFNTVVSLLNEELGTHIDPEYVENPIPEDVHIHNTWADRLKMRDATGWQPKIAFRDGICRVCAQYQ